MLAGKRPHLSPLDATPDLIRATLRSIHRLITRRTLVLLDEAMPKETRDVVLRSAAHFKPFFPEGIEVESPDASALGLKWRAFRSRSGNSYFRTSGLYLILCGWSASVPMRRCLSAS